MLQVLNPKLYVYAFTLFSAFLASITKSIGLLGLTASLLSMIAFSATSVWALFGTAIKTYLRYPRVKTVVNILLALFLVYAAIEAGWSESQFIKALRTGVTPSGHELSEDMPWQYIGQMTDEELQAVWLSLQSLPALEQGMERTDL